MPNKPNQAKPRPSVSTCSEFVPIASCFTFVCDSDKKMQSDRAANQQLLVVVATDDQPCTQGQDKPLGHLVDGNTYPSYELSPVLARIAKLSIVGVLHEEYKGRITGRRP